MNRFSIAAAVIGISLAATGCAAAPTAPTSAPATSAAPAPSPSEAMTEAATMDIVDTAVAAGSFTTLATALTEADLIETLKGEGPFTVFAPTDDAFAALPDGALDDLVADKDALTSVLTYHVVAGKVMASDVVGLDGQDVATVQGGTVKVTVEDGTVMLTDGAGNKAKVVQTDITATNGVIHVIDGVLLPE